MKLTPNELLERINDENLAELVETAISDMLQRGVDINIHVADSIPYWPDKPDQYHVSGYFVAQTGQTPRFGIAVNDDPLWMMTFIHEYCHFQQWIDDPALWNSQVSKKPGQPWRDVYDVIEEWRCGRESLTQGEMLEHFRIARDIELDCEKRTVDMIKKYSIDKSSDINVDDYIRKANAYVFSYSIEPLFQESWHTSPYAQENEMLWKQLPASFNLDYDMAWQPWVSRFWWYCYSPDTLEEDATCDNITSVVHNIDLGNSSDWVDCRQVS